MSIRTPSIKQVQAALIKQGYSVGKAGDDGKLGPDTVKAIVAFQKAKKLPIQWPGTLGPKTYEALGLIGLADTGRLFNPSWFQHGLSFLDLHEVRDSKKLDKILKLDASETPWCGAFAAMLFRDSLPNEPLPSNPLGARNWTKFGFEIPGPQVGAVVAFWRGTKNGWQGHVGIVAGHERNYVHTLGGNQSDSVSIARISKERLLGYYWPTTASKPPINPLVMTKIQATITQNEA